MTGAHVTARLVLSGTLIADTALQVGAASSDGIAADLEIARDGAERPIIPGTSLAGLLRIRGHAIAGTDPALLDAWCAMFGAKDSDPHSLDRSSDAPASLLVVRDAVLIDSLPRLERRDHVGIDRATGAAAERIKYDRIVLAAGARFALELILLARASTPPAAIAAQRRLLFALTDQLTAGVTVGAAATRGLGRVRLEDAPTAHLDPLADRGDAIGGLRRRLGLPGATPLPACDRPSDVPALPHDQCTITIAWQPDRAMLTRQGTEGELLDVLPLTTTVAAGRRTLLLAGASVKGALRFAAERIVRTATAATPPEPSDGSSRGHIAQLHVPLVTDLFGAPAQHAERAPDERDARQTGGRGALEIPDICARHDISDEDWQAALTADDPATAHHALRSAADGPLLTHAAVMTHVALDRWTQGASEGRLFDILEPLDVDWNPITLVIDTRRLHRPAPAAAGQLNLAAGALIWLLIQELRAGDLPLGGLITRGHGALTVTEATVRDGGLLGLTDTAELVDRAAAAAAWRNVIGVETT